MEKKTQNKQIGKKNKKKKPHHIKKSVTTSEKNPKTIKIKN